MLNPRTVDIEDFRSGLYFAGERIEPIKTNVLLWLMEGLLKWK